MKVVYDFNNQNAFIYWLITTQEQIEIKERLDRCVFCG